jgi:hypothetical protein
MADFFIGSVCVTDINEHGVNGHSAYNKGDNGKVYANVKIWVNDTPDKFGNSLSIQLNPAKDKDPERIYIGNAKTRVPQPPEKTDFISADAFNLANETVDNFGLDYPETNHPDAVNMASNDVLLANLTGKKDA